VLTFVYNFALYGLWIGLSVALLVGSIVSVAIVLLTDWNHEIERVRVRLAEDQDVVKIPTIVESIDTV
jgi:MATE family multidrug resistance protein